MKICVLGAGKRIHEMYGPITKTMPNLEICGFWNRDHHKGDLVAKTWGWKRYTDIDLMISENRPDALLVVINSSAIKSVVLSCIKYGIPIIMETPVWDSEIHDASSDAGVKVFVNEQTPFLPCEEFKMTLLNSGLFGQPTVVMNDCRTFEYHGISQLRRYIGFEKQPVEVVGSSVPHYPVSYTDNNGMISNQTEGWDFGVIKFSSGQTAVYNFSSIYNRAKFRKPRSMRIYCTRGTITNDDNVFEIHRLGDSHDTEKIDVNVVGEYMSTKEISAVISGHQFRWAKDDEIDHLNDQQVAVREIFTQNINAIKSNTDGYTCKSAYMDVNLLSAIRQSGAQRRFFY